MYLSITLKLLLSKKIALIQNFVPNGVHPEYPNLESYIKLLDFDIPRVLVKQPIMVSSYNATHLTMMDYLKDNFKYSHCESETLDNGIIKNKHFYTYPGYDGYFTDKDFSLMIKLIMEVIHTDFPKIKAFNTYLKQIAELHTKLNIAIP